MGTWEQAFDHPTPSAAQVPQWCGNEPFIPVHGSLIPVGPFQGWILVWDKSAASACLVSWPTNADRIQRWALVNPETQQVFNDVFLIPTAQAPPSYCSQGPGGNQGLFCAGHCWLPDGTLLVAGGDDWTTAPVPSGPCPPGYGFIGSKLVCRFDPWQLPDPAVAQSGNLGTPWSILTSDFLTKARWYPSLVVAPIDLNNVEILVCGGVETFGQVVAGTAHQTYEVYNFNLGSNTVTKSSTTPIPGPTTQTTVWTSFFYYPRLHLAPALGLPMGRVWMPGMVVETSWVDHVNFPGIWTPQPGYLMSQVPGAPTLVDQVLEECTAVLFPNISPSYEGRIMTFGGTIGDGHANPNAPITNKTFYLDTKNTLGWQAGPSMLHARKFANSVILPDGAVLITGGSQTNCHGSECIQGGVNTEIAVKNPETLINGHWLEGPAEESPRTYHSVALLLPSGKALSCGSDNMTRGYQVLRPHYMDGNPTAPKITSAPGTVGYGATFELGIELPFGQNVARAVLVSPGSVTHGHDPNQRFVQLTFAEHEPGGTATAPGERSLAPPGWYMLFVVSSAGVPSKARWIWLG